MSKSLLLIFALFSMSFSGLSKDFDLFSYALQSIDSNTEPLMDFSGQAKLVIFFSSDCHWCHKQIRLLNKLQEKCTETIFVGLGLNGSLRQAKDSLRQYRPNFPTFFANEKLRNDIGGAVATPFIIYANSNGELVKYAKGYQNQFEILREVSRNFPESCLLD